MAHSAPSSRLPLRVLDRIEPAGGSAYAWYDQELTAWLDPSGRWSALSRLLTRAGLTGLVGGWAVLAFWHQPWAGVVIAVLGAAGLVLGGWLRLPWWVGGAATLIAYPAGLHGLPLLILLLGLLAISVLGRARHRTAATALTATLAALGHLFAFGDLWDLAVSVVVVASGVTTLWWLSGRRLPLPLGRVTAEHLDASPPPPPSTVPWLLAHMPGNAKKMENPPKELARKRAGGYGERRTGLLLLGLRRGRGTRIGHDVDLPGADRANVDHFVLTRAGVFVVDSKQFGTQDDPGTVLRSGSDIVHRTNKGSRSLSSSLNTAAWATGALSGSLKVPARGILAVHRASVAPNLTFTRQDGVEVDVISANMLVERIDGAPRTMSRSALANAVWRCSRLRSSTTGRPPHLSTPLGVRGRARKAEPWQPDLDREQAAHERARAARLATETTPQPSQPSREVEASETTAEPMLPPSPPRSRPTAPAADAVGAASAQAVPTPSSTAVWADDDDPFAEEPVDEHHAAEAVAQVGPVFNLDPAAMEELTRLPEASREQVLGNWAQMEMAERADPGEVDPDLRTLARGDRIEVVEFADGDLRASEMVALTPACQGVDGPYVWVCLPSTWMLHEESGRPVFVGTVSADKVIRLKGKKP